MTMLLYISLYHEFTKRTITFRRLSGGMLNIPSQHYNYNKCYRNASSGHFSVFRFQAEYGLILLRAKYIKKFIQRFLIAAQFKHLRAIFDKKQNDGLHQLIFTPMFLKAKRSNYSSGIRNSLQTLVLTKLRVVCKLHQFHYLPDLSPHIPWGFIRHSFRAVYPCLLCQYLPLTASCLFLILTRTKQENITVPFNNMRTLKDKVQPINAFFARVNHMKCSAASSQVPATAQHCFVV